MKRASQWYQRPCISLNGSDCSPWRADMAHSRRRRGGAFRAEACLNRSHRTVDVMDDEVDDEVDGGGMAASAVDVWMFG